MTEGSSIRTVTGDIDSRNLGATNYHEHLFQVSPLLRGDELDDEALSQEEAGLLLKSGFDAMVDATPWGLGRRPDALARISHATGLRIIQTTGRHREEHYSTGSLAHAFSEEALGERFLADLVEGLVLRDEGEGSSVFLGPDGQPVRAGVLKAGIGYWSISAFERVTVEALAHAHRATGAPVMVHLEHCSAAHEILDLLASLEVPETSVALAHADRSLDAGLHGSLIERGAFLGYDGAARTKTHSDEQLLDLTKRVIQDVGPSNLLLGGDVARRSRYVAYGGMPGLAYLGLRYVPRLKELIGSDALNAILRTNPASWLGWQRR
jgi:phosphotriesterase-related protein